MGRKWKSQQKTSKTTQSREEIRAVVSCYEEFSKLDSRTLTNYDQFPLSAETRKGLQENEFTKPTDIQRDSLQYSLAGLDVIGAAKTGSGKTLALLIPTLERLWTKCWSGNVDGLGALIIVPTRELAFQIFQVLNKIGAHHRFSAGLLIGGTNVKFEKNRLARINIIVCTPGRLLQHMDENESFSCENLQILVIDEADRILDLGFEKQMNAILENLPMERQTLLFSATQTKNVKDLARLALRNPVYISVHEKAAQSTPETLQQSYIVCEDENKINTLWELLVKNRRRKMLIFVSCCKQARFFTEALCHLRPGLSLMGLWGTMNQAKRLEVFNKFNRKISSAALIATDVASRGLDFAKVDLVVQLDCPADVDDYIHRVGRTARMDAKGEAVLVLTTSQKKAMIEKLENRNIPINMAIFDQSHLSDISKKLQSTITQFGHLKEFAQRSFVAYIRSIYLMRHKDVFDVNSVNFNELARSYGLLIAPRVRFLARDERKKNMVNEVGPEKKEKGMSELMNMLLSSARTKKSFADSNEQSSKKFMKGVPVTEDNGDVFQKSKSFAVPVEEFADESQNTMETLEGSEDLLTIKRKDIFNVLEANVSVEKTSDPLCLLNLKKTKTTVTKSALAKKLLKSGIRLNTKKVFDDDEDLDETTVDKSKVNDEYGITDIGKVKSEMEEVSRKDKIMYKEKLKARRKEKKWREKERLKRDEDRQGAVLDLGDGLDDVEPDLSWLPNPDNPRTFGDDSSDVAANSGKESQIEQDEVFGVKRKHTEDIDRKRKRQKMERDEKIALALLS